MLGTAIHRRELPSNGSNAVVGRVVRGIGEHCKGSLVLHCRARSVHRNGAAAESGREVSGKGTDRTGAHSRGHRVAVGTALQWKGATRKGLPWQS